MRHCFGRKWFIPNRVFRMSVDTAIVKRVARLARIAVTDEEAERLRADLNAILGFVEQLNEVNVSGVEPMTSVQPMAMKKRADEVTDGFYPEKIVANAPVSERNFFVVPKVVE
jgi:aspartyl-tRNA(Asn)/glutamyl-tRNA(Gln) amidotransferase subunit C